MYCINLEWAILLHTQQPRPTLNMVNNASPVCPEDVADTHSDNGENNPANSQNDPIEKVTFFQDLSSTNLPSNRCPSYGTRFSLG